MTQYQKTFYSKNKGAFTELITMLSGIAALIFIFLYFVGCLSWYEAAKTCNSLKNPTDENIEFVLSSHGFNKDALDTTEPTTWEYITSTFKRK